MVAIGIYSAIDGLRNRIGVTRVWYNYIPCQIKGEANEAKASGARSKGGPRRSDTVRYDVGDGADFGDLKQRSLTRGEKFCLL